MSVITSKLLALGRTFPLACRLQSTAAPSSSPESDVVTPQEDDVIKEAQLREIGESMKLPHLSPGSFLLGNFVEGVILPPDGRLVVPLVGQLAEKKDTPIINFWTNFYPGSPHTFVSKTTAEAFFGKGNPIPEVFKLAILDPSNVIEARYSEGRFNDINVLGVAAILALQFNILPDRSRNRFYLLRSNMVKKHPDSESSAK